MPSDQHHSSRPPAKNWFRNRTSKSLDQGGAQNRSQNTSGEALRKTVQEWQRRGPAQKQRGSYGHEQKMLCHVNREQILVQGCQRRTNGEPNGNQSAEKRSSPPRRNRIGENSPQVKPSTQVNQRCQQESNRNWEG